MFSRAKAYLCRPCKSCSCTIIKLQPWTVIKWFDLGGVAAALSNSHITPNGLGTIHHYLKTSQELFQATVLLPCLLLPYCYKAVCSRLDGEKNAEKLPPATAAVCAAARSCSALPLCRPLLGYVWGQGYVYSHDASKTKREVLFFFCYSHSYSRSRSAGLIDWLTL